MAGLIGVIGAASGAGVSYMLGDRAQRGASRRDVFNKALLAVTTLRAARVMPRSTENAALSTEENARLTKELLLLGAQRHHVATLDARDAVATLIPYWPDAVRHRQLWELDDDELTGLIVEIRDLRDRRSRVRRSDNRGSDLTGATPLGDDEQAARS